MDTNSKNKKEKKTELQPTGSSSANHSEIEDGSSSLIPEELLESLPVEERGRITSIIKQSMFSGIINRRNPISEKITEDHITKLISNSDEQDKRDRKENNTERVFSIVLIIIALLFIVFLVVFLQNNEKLLITIITAILSFIGGFGLGKSISKKE